MQVISYFKLSMTNTTSKSINVSQMFFYITSEQHTNESTDTVRVSVRNNVYHPKGFILG